MQAPGQVQRGSGEGSEGSGEGLGDFGAEPGQVQQGSGEGSGEGLEKFAEKVLFFFFAGQVRFNGFWRSEGSGEGCREGSGEVCFFLFVFMRVHTAYM